MKIGTLLQQALERARQFFSPTPASSSSTLTEADFEKEKRNAELEATRATINELDCDEVKKKFKKFKKPDYARKPTMLPIEYSEGEILHQIQMQQMKTIHFNFASEELYGEETEEDWEERVHRQRLEHGKELEERWLYDLRNKSHTSSYGKQKKPLWKGDISEEERRRKRIEQEKKNRKKRLLMLGKKDSQDRQEEVEVTNKRARSYSLDVMSLEAAEFEQKVRIIDDYQQQLLPHKINVIPCPEFSTPQELQQKQDLIRSRRTYYRNIVPYGDHPDPGSYYMSYLNEAYGSLTYRGILKTQNVAIENEHMLIQFLDPINLYRKNVEECIKMSDQRLEIYDEGWKKAAYKLTIKNIPGFPTEEGKERQNFMKHLSANGQTSQGYLHEIKQDGSATWILRKRAEKLALAAEKRKKLRRRAKRERERLERQRQLEEQRREDSDSMYY